MKYTRITRIEELVSIRFDTDFNVSTENLKKVNDKLFFSDLEVNFKYDDSREVLKDIQNFFKPIKHLSGIKYKIHGKSKISISAKDYVSFLISDKISSLGFEGYLHYFLRQLFYSDINEVLYTKKVQGADLMIMQEWKEDKNNKYFLMFDMLRHRDNKRIRKDKTSTTSYIDSQLKENDYLRVFLSMFGYRTEKKEKEFSLFNKIILYACYLDIDLYLVIHKKEDFVICDKSNLHKHLTKGGFIMNLSEIIKTAYKKAFLNINELDELKSKVRKLVNFDIGEINRESIEQYLEGIVSEYDIFQNSEVFLKLKGGIIDYLELGAKTRDIDTHKWEKALSGYKEISKVYQDDKVVSLNIKIKKKFDKKQKSLK